MSSQAATCKRRPPGVTPQGRIRRSGVKRHKVVDYVVKGTTAPPARAPGLGQQKSISWPAARCRRRRARSIAVRARRFLQSGLAFTNAPEAEGGRARSTKLGARVCAPLYDCADVRRAELPHDAAGPVQQPAMYGVGRGCPFAMKPATARSRWRVRQELDAPVLAGRAAVNWLRRRLFGVPAAACPSVS